MTADSHQGVFGTNLFKTVHWIIEKKERHKRIQFISSLGQVVNY